MYKHARGFYGISPGSRYKEKCFGVGPHIEVSKFPKRFKRKRKKKSVAPHDVIEDRCGVSINNSKAQARMANVVIKRVCK